MQSQMVPKHRLDIVWPVLINLSDATEHADWNIHRANVSGFRRQNTTSPQAKIALPLSRKRCTHALGELGASTVKCYHRTALIQSRTLLLQTNRWEK